MNKDEKSLLLYFEDCAVNAWGKVAGIRMNKDDFEIADKWHEEKFVKFGRILFDQILKNSVRGFSYTHYVILSGKAWKEASLLRKERAKRHENINLLIPIRQ